MKLELKDLIRNKYYKIQHGTTISYAKFKIIKSYDYICFYDFSLYEDINGINYVNTTYYHSTFQWFDNLIVFEEIDPMIFIDHLPDTNSDKKAYLRQRKLNYLLKL